MFDFSLFLNWLSDRSLMLSLIAFQILAPCLISSIKDKEQRQGTNKEGKIKSERHIYLNRKVVNYIRIQKIFTNLAVLFLRGYI